MLLYDVFYYDAQTGRRMAEFDRCRAGLDKAPKGEVAHCVCVNWGQDESYWIDDHGQVIARPQII